MRDTYRYQFGTTSLALGSKTGFSYWEQQGIEPWSKPVQAIHTHGLQVIGVPRDLVKVLGRPWLEKARPGSVLLTAHFETEAAIYQLRVDTRVQLAFKEGHMSDGPVWFPGQRP